MAMDAAEAELRAIIEDSSLSSEVAIPVALMASVVHSADGADRILPVLKSLSADETVLAEALLQCTLFAGFPRALNALHAFRGVFGPAEASEPRQIEADDLVHFRSRGVALFRKIYGEHTDRVLELLDSYHPELRDWILVSAYGRVLSRDGIDVRVTELTACTALMVSGDLKQLQSHVRGALNVGATASEIVAAGELARALTGVALPESIQSLTA